MSGMSGRTHGSSMILIDAKEAFITEHEQKFSMIQQQQKKQAQREDAKAEVNERVKREKREKAIADNHFRSEAHKLSVVGEADAESTPAIPFSPNARETRAHLSTESTGAGNEARASNAGASVDPMSAVAEESGNNSSTSLEDADTLALRAISKSQSKEAEASRPAGAESVLFVHSSKVETAPNKRPIGSATTKVLEALEDALKASAEVREESQDFTKLSKDRASPSPSPADVDNRVTRFGNAAQSATDEAHSTRVRDSGRLSRPAPAALTSPSERGEQVEQADSYMNNLAHESHLASDANKATKRRTQVRATQRLTGGTGFQQRKGERQVLMEQVQHVKDKAHKMIKEAESNAEQKQSQVQFLNAHVSAL